MPSGLRRSMETSLRTAYSVPGPKMPKIMAQDSTGSITLGTLEVRVDVASLPDYKCDSLA